MSNQNNYTVSAQAIGEATPSVDTSTTEYELSQLDVRKAPDVEKITQEEFDKLSIDEIKLIVAAYITDFRKTYKIPQDYQLNDKDWVTIKRIMKYQLFRK